MSCLENNQTWYLEGHTLREFSVFLQVRSSQKKQRNQTIGFPWELYLSVELFLLWYVICASVPTEGTRILRWLVLIFSRGESIACAYPNQLYTHKTWQETIWQHAAIFLHFFYLFLYGYLFLCSIDLWVLCDEYHRLFCIFGDFHASGTQDAEVTESLSVLQAKK